MDYTGRHASVSNIQWAFAEKLLISPDTFEGKVEITLMLMITINGYFAHTFFKYR